MPGLESCYKMVEDAMKPDFKVGDIVDHPEHGKIKIIDGQFWGMGGVSNFWHWRKVNKDGTLSKKIYHGYGWKNDPQTKKEGKTT